MGYDLGGEFDLGGSDTLYTYCVIPIQYVMWTRQKLPELHLCKI